MAKQRLEAFHIRKGKTAEGERSFWTRCGVAFVNKDGSINLKLEMVPLDGEVHLRAPNPKKDAGTTDNLPEGFAA